MIKYFAANQFYFLFLIAILSAIIGSFLNVIIYRLPIIMQRTMREECLLFLAESHEPKKEIFNLLYPFSHCPRCEANIPWWCNIPILSFIVLRGKCYSCSTRISWRYPIVELLTILVSLYVIFKLGITWQSLAIIILTWGLIPLVFIDIAEQILPDILLLPLLWFGLILNSFHIFTTPENAILGAVYGYLSLWIVAAMFKLIRKVDGMGHGDFKLLALFGAWFGWQVLLFIILLASLAGALIGIALIIFKKHALQKPMAFGPYIAIAGWFFIFYGDNIRNFFYRLIALC